MFCVVSLFNSDKTNPKEADGSAAMSVESLPSVAAEKTAKAPASKNEIKQRAR